MADCKKYGRTANLCDESDILSGDNYVIYMRAKPYRLAAKERIIVSLNHSATAIIIVNAASDAGLATRYGGNTLTFAWASALDIYVALSFNNGIPQDLKVMLNIGSTPLPYQPYYGWVHSLRKLGSSTDTITTLPADLYADGTNATVGLKGNMVQTGTPSPDNPIQPSECGERTDNLFDMFDIVGQVPTIGTGELIGYNGSTTSLIPINSGLITLTKQQGILIYLMLYASDKSYIGYTGNSEGENIYGSSVTGYENAKYCRVRIDRTTELDTIRIMLNSGSTAKPYEPYGYKIPISSANTTTPVYLGEVESTRQIKKLVLTGEEGWKNLTSDNTRFYLDVITPDYIRADSQITYMCTHYVPYEQTTSATLVPNLNMSMSSAPAQRLYITDSNYTSVADFKAYLAQQYTAGTPVCVWYVLATPETGIVNEPLRKIGDYADTVSGITIPTITGKDTFDVETTLKPSEVSLSYTGWHDASVKEKSENLLNISAFTDGYNIGNDGLPYSFPSPPNQMRTCNLVPIDVTAINSCTLSYTNSGVSFIFSTLNNGTLIQRSAGNASGTVIDTSSANELYICFYTSGNISKTDITNAMLNIGSTALPYEPYWK